MIFSRPSRIHCTEDAARLARQRLPRMMYDFIAGATGRETGKRLNRDMLDLLRLQPRVLINVEQRKLATTLLGQAYDLPFGIAPMGMCNLAWPGADRMLADLALKKNIPLCLSSAASTSIEDVAQLSEGKAWFQLYVYTSENQASAFTLVDRAKAAGYDTLVLTVDVPQVSQRTRDLRNGEDVVKALASGADFVMLGRPWLYAVGAAGSQGAERLADILAQDIDTVMAQLGVTTVADINQQVIAAIQVDNGLTQFANGER